MTPLQFATNMCYAHCSSLNIKFVESNSICFIAPNEIHLPKFVAQVFNVINVAAVCHEVAHLIQHHHWPWLFALRKRTRHIVLGYLINLFLEHHASKLALRYLRNTGVFSAQEMNVMETLARKSFKTYL